MPDGGVGSEAYCRASLTGCLYLKNCLAITAFRNIAIVFVLLKVENSQCTSLDLPLADSSSFILRVSCWYSSHWNVEIGEATNAHHYGFEEYSIQRKDLA